MVASWRIGDLIVTPDGQLGLAWLLVGAPGAGKTTAIERLAFLAGLERRHLVVVDAKGGHDGLAGGVVAAYLAAWPDARIRAVPQRAAGHLAGQLGGRVRAPPRPAALERVWADDQEILGLVRSMSKGKNNELAGVHIRVGDLIAALAGALDGQVSWEDADYWVVTVPAMVASRDADSALRVMLSDSSHFTMARKGRGRRCSS